MIFSTWKNKKRNFSKNFVPQYQTECILCCQNIKYYIISDNCFHAWQKYQGKEASDAISEEEKLQVLVLGEIGRYRKKNRQVCRTSILESEVNNNFCRETGSRPRYSWRKLNTEMEAIRKMQKGLEVNRVSLNKQIKKMKDNTKALQQNIFVIYNTMYLFQLMRPNIPIQ